MGYENRTFAYFIDRDAIAIVKRSVSSGENTYSSPSEAKTVTVVAKAIQRGYELNIESLAAAQYWENQFEKGVREGKRYANTGRTEKVVIKGQGFEPTVYSTRDKDES